MDKRIPQKIQILKFVAEQGIVSAADVNRYFFAEDKTNVILTTMYQLGLANIRLMAIESKMFLRSGNIQFVTLEYFYKEYGGRAVEETAKVEEARAV